MRVLCCNPVFFEYRLPLYEELKRLFEGDFYVMYSPVRYKMCGKEAFCQQIKTELAENAIELHTDHLFDTNAKKWDVMPDIEKGNRIPLTWGLMRAIRKVKPDVLITVGYFQWTPFVLLYGLLHRIPVYMEYERTCWTERNAGRLKTIQRKLFNRLFSGFLVNGSETRKYLLGLGVPEMKIKVGGMCAGKLNFNLNDDPNLNPNLNDNPNLNLNDDPNGNPELNHKMGLRFLFSGAIAERKGVTHLIEAWKEHIMAYPYDELTLVGDGNQMDLCKKMSNDIPSIHLAGRIPYDEIGSYYARADVYILPTIEDNWSLVIPEAMSCGLPVATSIYNGCHPELIHEGVNGFTFDTFRHETIVEVLAKFHRVDLKAMGMASRRIEQDYNVVNTALRIYNALMEVP